MDQRTLLSRIGSGLSLPMAILLLIFFFMPWTECRCSTMQLGEADGWQLTKGDMTAVQPRMSSSAISESTDARPWFIFGLIVPITLLGVGALGVAGAIRATGAGKAMIILGAIGIAVMLLAANVDYSGEFSEGVERYQNQKTREAAPRGVGDVGAAPPGLKEAMTDEISLRTAESVQTEPTVIVWTSLVLYILVAGCGVTNLVAPIMLKAMPAPAPAAPMPPPPCTERQ